ncbi:MAG: T9SS type A sorting domain-containing protein [Chitinophagales bacterium]
MKSKQENAKSTRSSATKLASYSALAATFITIGAEADAQIFYSDIPDVVLDENGETYAIDLNGDLVNDIELRKAFITFFDASLVTASSGIGSGTIQFNHIYATPLGNNSIAGVPSPYAFSSYPYALSCSEVIGAGRQWLNEASEIVVYSLLYKINAGGGGVDSSQILADGYWVGGETDKYLGVKLDISGAIKYGWIRMDVSADNKTVTIKDFAFENTSGFDILAGAPNVNPEECLDNAIDLIPEEDVFVYSFDNTIYLSIKNNELLGSDISVMNSLGEEIYVGLMDATYKNITLQNQPAGIYFLRLLHNNARFTKQLFIVER